ncbi:hypothetical protein Tco_0850889 [Tanacetum coccineum]
MKMRDRLKDAFPILYALENVNDCKVMDHRCFANNVWGGNWSWRVPPRGRTIDELSSLILLIGNLFIISNGTGKWIWTGDASGKFKVSSLTKSIQNFALGDSAIGYHHLWNPWIPRNVNICVIRTLGCPGLNKILYGVVSVTVWALWKWRNRIVNVAPDADVGNVPVWVKLHGVLITTFSEDGLSAIAIKLGTSLMLDYYTFDMCLQSWGMSSYARVMIEIRADIELKDNIVEECPKNIGLGMAKNLKKPSQTSRSVLVGLKLGFKPHKEYRPVPKKPTTSLSGNKKKGVAHTNEVSNSNPFDVLNSVDNDVEFATNGGTTNLVNNGANSSGSSFINVENSSTCYAPIIDKIGEFEDLLIDGQAILVDGAGNPLKKVECPSDYDSEDEVASVDRSWLVLWLMKGYGLALKVC